MTASIDSTRARAPEVAESAASGASTGLWFAAAVFGTQRTARD